MPYYLPNSVLDPEMPWNRANAAQEITTATGYPMDATRMRDAAFSGASLQQILQNLQMKLAADLQMRQQDITQGLGTQSIAAGLSPFIGNLGGRRGYGARRMGGYPPVGGRTPQLRGGVRPKSVGTTGAPAASPELAFNIEDFLPAIQDLRDSYVEPYAENPYGVIG